MDPPTWFTAVPATYAVDARLPLMNFFLAGSGCSRVGLGAGLPVVAHGMNKPAPPGS